MTNEVWAAAEFLTEWHSGDWNNCNSGLTYKLLRVPRAAIDEDDDSPDALLLLGLDPGNVRRVEILIDTCYDRMGSGDDSAAIEEALQSAPEDARDEIERA